MPVARLSLLLTLAVLASPVSAEPIRAQVRSWITPVPGQTPFTPGPGDYVPDAAFDLTPGTQQRIASFGPSDAWVTPLTTLPLEATLVSREYLFTYNVEVTDVASGQTGTATLPGSAFANWIQQPDGLVVDPQTGVTVGAASGDLLLGANRYRLDALAYPSIQSARMATMSVPLPQPSGADVMISAAPAVPEPTTLALAAGGLGAMGAGVWRRKRSS